VRSALSEATLKKAAAENLPKEGEVVPSPPIVSVKPAHDWGDPLEIDTLFDVPASTPVPEPAISNAAATVVLEAPLVETKTALMPSIDSKEIDTRWMQFAWTAWDLHQEARQRDEMLASNSRRTGQIKHPEFEASIAATQMTPRGQSGELELDEVHPHIGMEPPVAAAETTPQPIKTGAPNFAIKPSSSKSWLPILVLILLAVMAGVYFWFWG
jgi:hypothetical protein